MKYSNSNNFDLGVDLSFDRWLANPTKFMDEVQAEIDEKVQKSAKKKAEEKQQQYIAYQKAVAEIKEYAARKQQEADNFYLQHPEEIQIGGGGSFSFANEPLIVPSAINTSSENITEIDSSPKMSRKEARLMADTEKANELGITVEELRSQRAKAAHQTAELNAKIRAAEMGMTVDQYKEYRKKINRDNRDKKQATKLGITVEELRQQKEKEKEKKKAERKAVKAKAKTATAAKPQAKKDVKSSTEEHTKTKSKPTVAERIHAFNEKIKQDKEEMRKEMERYARNTMWDAIFSKTNNEYTSDNVYVMLQDVSQVGDDKALGDALRDAIDNKIDYDSLVALTHEVMEKRLGDAYDYQMIQNYLDRVYNDYTEPRAAKQTSFNHPADENEPTTQDEQDALEEFIDMPGGKF